MKAKLIAPIWLTAMFFLLDAIYREVLIKGVLAQGYEVDVNPLFDIDEEFLYSNEAYRALIKKIATHYETLISPNYDLTDIKEQENAFYTNNLSGKTFSKPEFGEMIPLYLQAFNMPMSWMTDAYTNMMNKYRDFFE